jgi:hypothetical protein
LPQLFLVAKHFLGSDEMPVGHVPHLSNDETRAQVELLAAFGISHENIGKEIGLSLDTLRRHYSQELDRATSSTLLKVAQNMYEFACGLKGSDKVQLSAGAFWLRMCAGLRETTKREHPGSDSSVIEITMSGPDKVI